MVAKESGKESELDERLSALVTNVTAVRAVTSAIEGTLGPNGLDVLLVGRLGDVVVSNDGATILETMDASHPAARMLIRAARAQEEEVGDGTTTTVILAGALVSEGAGQVARGVPISRVLQGIEFGLEKAAEFIRSRARVLGGTGRAHRRTVVDPSDQVSPQGVLLQAAKIAARGQSEVAKLVVAAAQVVGQRRLKESSFRFKDLIVGQEGGASRVIGGVLIHRDTEPMGDEVNWPIRDARILVVDDALEPEKIDEEALRTESGFARFLACQEEFRQHLHKLVELGVNLVVVDRSAAEIAHEILGDAGVALFERVPLSEWRRAAEHTGARPVKRTMLRRGPEDLARCLGFARRADFDQALKQLQLTSGRGARTATVVLSAATAEVMDERLRIGRDAASAVQATVQGGYVPGGGAIEIAAGLHLEKLRGELPGMAGFGLECVIEALTRPLSQIVANSGFNPLEKVREVMQRQAVSGCDSLGIDCETGEVCEMLARGVIDPAPVKVNALRTAGEIAQAVLRVNTIIKKRERDGRV
ncbi:MAG: TCP-1/cpn60 chaperonin family protein [Firmicutes bacterium]|nr:TCP-1/cpn60 chaperonin family protein [Bacillota bacterium]